MARKPTMGMGVPRGQPMGMAAPPRGMAKAAPPSDKPMPAKGAGKGKAPPFMKR